VMVEFGVMGAAKLAFRGGLWARFSQFKIELAISGIPISGARSKVEPRVPGTMNHAHPMAGSAWR